MTPDLPCLKIARIVIESLSPISIGTGFGIGTFDTSLVRDANGLPTIPATSVAGVLRHSFARYYGQIPGLDQDETDSIFGCPDQDDRQGKSSRIEISFGFIHDQDNRPIDRLLLGEERNRLKSDSLLAGAARDVPLSRDYVRLDGMGTAAEQAKFDRTMLPAGYRFTIELALWCESLSDHWLDQILGLFDLPEFRLGGGTRKGLGKVKRVPGQTHIAEFDLRTLDGVNDLKAAHDDLSNMASFREASVESVSGDKLPLVGKLVLSPEDFWRIGQGDAPYGNYGDREPPAAIVLTERVVDWQSDRGQLEERRRVVVPASSIKGSLSHRATYHINCAIECFAERMQDRPAVGKTGNAAEGLVSSLFGSVKQNLGSRNSDDGPAMPNEMAGRVLLDDVYLEDGDSAIMMHNSIDRFTGGARHGALFGEELMFCGQLEIPIVVLESDQIPKMAKDGFAQALEDMIQGRLAIGAGASRGHGFCSGRIEGEGLVAWLQS